MKRYKAELVCRITAFTDLTVEADTPEQARDIAIKEAGQLSKHDWDLEEVDDIELNTFGLPYELSDEAEIAEVKKFYSEDWTRVIVPPKKPEGIE